MALVDSALASALKAIFDQMTEEKSNDWYADELAKAIDAQIKTAIVNTNVTIPSTSPPGSPSTGTGVGSLS
ncbi:MAG: hypothetical protein LBK83_01360 [Treponema sp.]|jgi:hypothetical protein|nr:hypothetical protein [Treponema sp.]